MIEAYGLTKRYGDRTVVHDLDFTVHRRHPGTPTDGLPGGPDSARPSTSTSTRTTASAPVPAASWSRTPCRRSSSRSS
ncbi:hypothetical protein DBP15_14030 [Streptomyces sp. CS065A]|nr:hypothetical protein DBP15_14030 [Streptomyces sp. CS065A]